MSFGDQALFPTLPCTIGAKVGQCLLDTGSNFSFVSINEDSAQFLVLSRARSVNIYGETVTEIVEAPLFKIGNAFVKSNVPVVRSNNFRGLPEMLGVIGADMLIGNDFIFYLSGARGVDAKLIKLEAGKSEGAGVLILNSPFIELAAAIDGRPIRAMWDTHMNWTYFSKRFIKEHPKLFKKQGMTKSTDVGGNEAQIQTYKFIGQLCLAPGVCENSDSLVSDFTLPGPSGQGESSFDVMLGHDWIYKFNWLFSYSKKTFAIERREVLSGLDHHK
jgi:hypothetical protein